MRVYANSFGAELYHYQDYKNQEFDAVIELPDKRWFKPRAAALMVVGGASTKNWTSFGLPSMFELFSNGMSIVDAYSAHGGMEYEHMIGNEKLMARMTKMGDNLADALETEGGLDKWYGDDEGVCPV